MNNIEKKQEDVYILGIETSCDETSASVVKNGKEILSNVVNTQLETHKRFRRSCTRNSFKDACGKYKLCC